MGHELMGHDVMRQGRGHDGGSHADRGRRRQPAGMLALPDRRGLLAIAAMVAMVAVLVVPVRADAQTAGSAWPQGAADAQNSNQATVNGPSDPGLKWAIDLEAISTAEAPDGYSAGGGSAVHRPIIGPDGDVVVPVSNQAPPGRDALVALDPQTGDVTWEVQSRLTRCAPAVDRQGRTWIGLRFDRDDEFNTAHLRAFDASGVQIDGTGFDLADLGVATPDRWCGFDAALHTAGTGANERLVLFHVGDNEHIAALDISGATPTIAWQLDAGDVAFDRFENGNHGGPGAGPSARLAAMTDTQMLVPVRTGDQHQLAFISLANGDVERVVDLPAFTIDGESRDAPVRGSVTVMIVGNHAVASLSDRGDYAGVLHGVSLAGTSTTPDWTQLLPSDTGSVNGAEVMAVSGGNVVAPSLGQLQAHNAASGAAASWSNGPDTLTTSSQLVTDAGGAIYTMYRPASGAMNLVRYSANGTLDWQLRRTSLAVEGLIPGTEDIRVGPIDGDGTLYVRIGSLLYAIDNSGGLADCEIPFDDVAESNVHAENICRLVELAVTTGISDTQYGPSLQVTRAQMGTFLQRALGLPPSSTNRFPDVDPGSVHAPGINAIAEAGITLGRADGTYDPNGSVTRAEMASFLARAAQLEGVQGTGFTDVDPTNVHTPNIYAVRDAEITTGVTATTFDPDGNVTRAQMASFLIRTIEAIDGADG
jgi:hypothetical protein